MALLIDPIEGSEILGRAVTATLFVSPDGDDSNGSSWKKAYNELPDALDVASTDGNDHTVIMIAPGSYDINTTGNPTWSGNYTLKGSHRTWAKIKNDHESATCVLKFTGLVSLEDLEIEAGTGSNNGVIISGTGTKGFRARHMYFECEHVTGAQTALCICDHTEYARMEDVMFHGVAAYTTALILDWCKLSHFKEMQIHECLVGIKIIETVHEDSSENFFDSIMIDHTALAIDIDGGDNQLFRHITLFGNTRNVDDEVGNHHWESIEGNFPIYVYPDDFTGVTVPSETTAGAWGPLTTVIAANAIDNPFRVVGTHFRPAVSQESRVRFTGNGGALYYDDIFFDGNKRENAAAPSGTEFIFNTDTEIEAAAKVIGGGPDNIVVWVEIQEI